MILWSLARSASSAPVFPDKFSAFSERFFRRTQGIPLLRGAAALFECHSRHRYCGGDHIILIGNVERYTWSEAAPLLFHRGRYRP